MKEYRNDYKYVCAEPSWSNHYLWPPLQELLKSRIQTGRSVMDVGCGSGATAGMLADLGFSVTAVDPSKSGIRLAREAYPDVEFAERSAYDDLRSDFGEFDIVISLEVVEHCFSPRLFAKTLFSLLRPGGLAFISTPYHGYWKNLALALTNKFDAHWAPLWDGGHIKFWSPNTLRTLLDEIGFVETEFLRVGRIPPLAKSMIAIARRPR